MLAYASIRVLRAVLAAIAATALLGLAPAYARTADTKAPVIAVADLPADARETLKRIRAGGPFPYERDGVVFGNFERHLPRAARGYYREYTVRTPGVSHRGARRIVAGRDGELYYTDDHYQTFKRIIE